MHTKMFVQAFSTALRAQGTQKNWENFRPNGLSSKCHKIKTNFSQIRNDVTHCFKFHFTAKALIT